MRARQNSLSVFETQRPSRFDYHLHAPLRLLCFLTRQPDKLVVVWTRRSRRKSSKVCAEAKLKNIAQRFLLQRLTTLPLSHSPTAGSRASKTPTEEWWCGLCRRTSRSPSRFLRCGYKLVSLHWSPCPLTSRLRRWRGPVSLRNRRTHAVLSPRLAEVNTRSLCADRSEVSVWLSPPAAILCPPPPLRCDSWTLLAVGKTVVASPFSGRRRWGSELSLSPACWTLLCSASGSSIFCRRSSCL